MKAKPEAKPEAKSEAKFEEARDMFMQAWKAQLDAGLRVLETITEGAIRMHEAQLEARPSARRPRRREPCSRRPMHRSS